MKMQPIRGCTVFEQIKSRNKKVQNTIFKNFRQVIRKVAIPDDKSFFQWKIRNCFLNVLVKHKSSHGISFANHRGLNQILGLLTVTVIVRHT